MVDEIFSRLRELVPELAPRVERLEDRAIIEFFALPPAWTVTGVAFVLPMAEAETLYPAWFVRPLFIPDESAIAAEIKPPWRLGARRRAWAIDRDHRDDTLRVLHDLLHAQSGRYLEGARSPAGFIDFVGSSEHDEPFDPPDVREALAYAHLLVGDARRAMDLLTALCEPPDAMDASEPIRSRASQMLALIRVDVAEAKRQISEWRDASAARLEQSLVSREPT